MDNVYLSSLSVNHLIKYFSIKCGPEIILLEYSLKYCSYTKDQSLKLKKERLP
jgi:hypothetical protein